MGWLRGGVDKKALVNLSHFYIGRSHTDVTGLPIASSSHLICTETPKIFATPSASSHSRQKSLDHLPV